MIELGIGSMRPEKRESGGSFSDSVLRLIESQAAGTAADASSTAAVECASGALSRAFAAAEVQAPSYVQGAVTPEFLGQVGRDLVRRGQSMHVITVSPMGGLSLLPCSSWHFEGDAHPSTWTVRATVYGPSSSTTRHVPFAGVVFVKWGATPGQPYVGVGPTRWAAITARLQSEVERSLADEASGPIANLLPVPQDGGADDEGDPLASLKADIRAARGRAVLTETTSAGWGEGPSAAPRQDWKAQRLGPNPPAGMADVLGQSFFEVLAACGIPPAMFLPKSSDGGQREAYRRWCALVVQPLGRLLAAELSLKLETEVTLGFEKLYAHDLAGRARAAASMVQSGVDPAKAMALSGLMEGE